jgi:hypothetical protein
MRMLPLAIAATLAFSGASARAASINVPHYDVAPGCRSVARSSEMPGKDAQACIDDELRLRDELATEWPTFNADDKARCTRRLSLAWRPTYTELVTCLEIARAARELPDQLTPATVPRKR